jgi:hypothetical protein
LTVGIQGQLGEASRKLGGNDPLRRDSSVVERQDLLGLGRLQAQGIPENLLDLSGPPSGFLFKKGFQFGQGVIPLPPHPAHPRRVLKQKVLAEVFILAVLHPFRGRFAALVLGIGIVQAAVQTAMKVAPAMRANLLPAHPALNLGVLAAGVTDQHVLIIHIFDRECKGERC